MVKANECFVVLTETGVSLLFCYQMCGKYLQTLKPPSGSGREPAREYEHLLLFAMTVEVEVDYKPGEHPKDGSRFRFYHEFFRREFGR